MTLPQIVLNAVPVLPAIAAVAIPRAPRGLVDRHGESVTACYATSVMLVRSDVKGKLAWSTAGQMGA